MTTPRCDNVIRIIEMLQRVVFSLKSIEHFNSSNLLLIDFEVGVTHSNYK